MIQKVFPALACLLLVACADKSETQTEAEVFDVSGAAIEIPVTSQIMLPEKGVAYTFVPNDAAQWLSHIIILSEDGDLYQATADSQDAKPIEGPKAKAVIGLSRPGAAGVFFAINEDNTLQAYIESNDAGDFKALTDDLPDVNIIELCETSPALECELGENGQISAIETKAPASLVSSKGQHNLKMSDNSIIVSEPESSDVYTPVTITNGITILGVTNPQSVHTTSDNFGGPFNNGLVLVSDADEPRFVIISADRARKELEAQPTE